MTPKSFELMSDLEKMVLEDVASYQTKQGRTLLFNTKIEVFKELEKKAVTDYWSNYFKVYQNDERP